MAIQIKLYVPVAYGSPWYEHIGSNYNQWYTLVRIINSLSSKFRNIIDNKHPNWNWNIQRDVKLREYSYIGRNAGYIVPFYISYEIFK